jgi:hypothetical protein
MIQIDQKFALDGECYGKITEVFSQGFHFHTIDKDGNCIKGQQYKLKSEFNQKPYS